MPHPVRRRSPLPLQTAPGLIPLTAAAESLGCVLTRLGALEGRGLSAQDSRGIDEAAGVALSHAPTSI